MSSSGAKAALEGYRKQALYTLACILHPSGKDLVFQPEGSEDLAVFRGQHPFRTVQVKAYSDNLTLSCFAPGKPRSFLHRVTDHATDDNVAIEVISFGPIGTEIEGAWSGVKQHCESVRRKLRSHNFTDIQIDTLFSRLRWYRVDEEELQRQVFYFLRDSTVGGDPQSAFDLLLVWVYFAAEKRQKITYAELITKINDIGRYLASRTAHHQEWFTSIVPIEDGPVDETNRDQLSAEFYNGVSTRYSHILAGFDVPRQERLNCIEQAFASDIRTVIIHGASGQGKTTLALRYLHDFVPEAWRYSIRYLQDKAHVASVANALAGHLRVVDAPLYLHIDISPRDREWTELVKNLLDEKNIRILITIREEDLARNVTPDAELGFPKSIALNFDRNEAKNIYERLTEQNVTDGFPSFGDAWTRFGGEGLLLEFVYFITQAESLKERLHKQVSRLREDVRIGQMMPEELAFMRICAVASAFEARIDVASLAAALHLPDPIRLLQLLEKEYLLRPSHDMRHIEALHPIRSDILADELTNPTFAPWQESAQLAINHMPESDLESFLLYSFSRRQADVEFLVGVLGQYRLRTWTGVAAISRALLWLGVYEYTDANMALITEAKSLFTHAWCMALRFDISDVSSGSDDQLLEAMKLLEVNTVEAAEKLRAKQTDKSAVFTRIITWITGSNAMPNAPESASDWAGFAEAHFWCRHLKLEPAILQSVASLDLSWPLVHLSFRGLGEVILSLSYSPNDLYTQVVDPFQCQIMERFRTETRTIAIEETGEMTRAHYLVPMESPLNSNEDKAKDLTGDRLEKETIKLLHLLRMFIPNRKAYGVQGYGHNLRFIPLPYDLTAKGPVESRYLLPEWPVRLNAIFHNLGDLRLRQTTWKEYAESTVAIREQIVTALKSLVKALTAYFAGNRADILGRKLPHVLWEESNKAVNQYIPLPKSAVDEWGLTSDGAGVFSNESSLKAQKNESISLLIQSYLPFLKAKGGYFSSLGNFFNQSFVPLVINSNIGRMKTEGETERYLEKVTALGYKPGTDRLSLMNLGEAWKDLSGLQTTFHALLSRFVANDRLLKLEREEDKIFPIAWTLWYQFVHHPKNKFESADIRAVGAFDRAHGKLRDSIRRRLSTLADSGWSGSIISETVPWEGRPSLWLRLDAENSKAIFEGFERFIQLLEDAFTPMHVGTLEHYVLDHKWPNILIIPFIAGEYWQNGIWHISSCLFWGGEKVLDPEKVWRFIPKEIEFDTLQQLGIESARQTMPGKIQLLQQATSELLVYVDHLADLGKAPDELDEIGVAILQKHVAAKAHVISVGLTRMVGQMQVLLDEVNTGVFDSSPHSDEIRRLLVSIWECVKPKDNIEDSFEFELGACDQWAERLLEGLAHMTFLNYLYVLTEN